MLVKNLLKQTDQLLTFNSTLDKKYEFQLLLSISYHQVLKIE